MRFIFDEPNLQQQEFTLPLGRTLIGSEERVDTDVKLLDNQNPDYYLVISLPAVSINHALVTYSGFDVFIRDLDSAAGTFVDGQRLPVGKRVELYPGARIGIGTHIQLLLEDDSAPVEKKESLPPIRLSDFDPIDLVPAKIEPIPYHGRVPPGCAIDSLHFLNFLPEIYQPSGQAGDNAIHIQFTTPPTDFLSRFLAIFESIYLPLDWTVSHADLFLDPKTATIGYIDWMEQWFGIPFARNWSLEKRRKLLLVAEALYAMRGTKWALEEVLTIYTGEKPMIDENVDTLAPFDFNVSVNLKQLDVTGTEIMSASKSTNLSNPEERRDESIRKVEPIRKTIAEIIEHFKPVHTRCREIILVSQ